MPSYIIHSGWWCDETGQHIGSKYNESDDRTRSPLFFDVWHESILTFAKPEKIIVVDSASPVRPELADKDVEWVSMKRNFLHGMICDSMYGGWSRAFCLGAYYAFLNDADYAVFLEQDCLIAGEGIIESVIEKMGRKRISYGASSVVRIEQSFVVIRHDYLLTFLNTYLRMPQSDKDLFTEVKFQRIQKKDRVLGLLGVGRDNYMPLPVGVGRNRPIDFGEKRFYAQHWTTEELRKLKELTGFESLKRLLEE
jgi:hypothetical protein